MNAKADNRAKEVKAIFLESLDRTAGAERRSYLEAACGGDAALRREVESLLHAHQEAGEFLDPAAFGAGTGPDYLPLTEGPGTVIGRYKLLEKIGEGGMAVVYMAEQEQPIRRKVALKIIKLGMDTKQVIARFEAERQALALMDHPSIAKVLDAGATETGRPYFVMELVQGVSITEYCDGNNLNTEDRLALFVQVCHAVQHAHTKGIIHRDIKPSNVMVTHHDSRPVPKVIDFGIAKATNQRLTEKTLFTRYAHLIGTPAYMSPEQAELSDLDIDTRTDIYSLGVLLYELLTGTTPFSEEELRKAGYIEMQRVIREQEPVKPSTRIRTAHVAQPPPAGKPSAGEIGSPPRAGVLQRRRGYRSTYEQVRGDLDWIVMKSLAKDRNRRYETARTLAEDIERHLRHEPITAGSPGTIYRARKYLRRHRIGVVAGLVAAMLSISLVLAAAMGIRARTQQGLAESLEHAQILAEAESLLTGRRYEEALNALAPILKSRHAGAKARLLHARTLIQSQKPQEALPELETLLDEPNEVAGQAHFLLATIHYENDPNGPGESREYREKWNYHRRQAEKLLADTASYYFLEAKVTHNTREMLGLLSKALNADRKHYASLQERAYVWYAQQDYPRMESDAQRMIGIQPDNPAGYSLSATALQGMGRLDEAVDQYSEAIRLSPTDPSLYERRRQAYMQMGEYQRALADAQKCVQLQPDSIEYQRGLCVPLAVLGEYGKASDTYKSILVHPSAEQQFSPDWPACGPMHIKLWFCGWTAHEVFRNLCVGVPWHRSEKAPRSDVSVSMQWGQDHYDALRQCARRVIDTGYHPSWSPDGTKLAYSVGMIGASAVAIRDLQTGRTEILTIPGADPEWSPDGRFIAYVRDRQILPVAQVARSSWRTTPSASREIWLFELATGRSWPLTKGLCPTWSDDSSRIYFQSEVDHSLYCVLTGVSHSSPQRVLASCGSFPAISPDGRYVADGVFRLMRIADVASQKPVVTWAAPPVPKEHLQVHWSSDGRELSVCGSQCTDMGLWIYDRASGTAAKIVSGPITAARWSRDGRKLAIEIGAPHFEIWLADLKSGVPTPASFPVSRSVEEHCRERMTCYKGMLEQDPVHVAVCYWLADTSLWLEDPEAPAIVEQFDRLMKEPNVEGCLSRARRVLLSPPQVREKLLPLACLIARRAMETEPQNPECLSAVALSLCRDRNWREALTILDGHAEVLQNRTVDCLCRAVCQWHLGDRAHAQESYDQGMRVMREKDAGDPLLEMFREETASLLAGS